MLCQNRIANAAINSCKKITENYYNFSEQIPGEMNFYSFNKPGIQLRN